MASSGARRVLSVAMLRALGDETVLLGAKGVRDSDMVEIVGAGLGTILRSASSYEAILGGSGWCQVPALLKFRCKISGVREQYVGCAFKEPSEHLSHS